MNVVKRIVIYLVRKRLRLKLYQPFRFSNQKTDDVYYFARSELKKVAPRGGVYSSNVALSWLLSDNCEIVTKEVEVIR